MPEPHKETSISQRGKNMQLEEELKFLNERYPFMHRGDQLAMLALVDSRAAANQHLFPAPLVSKSGGIENHRSAERA